MAELRISNFGEMAVLPIKNLREIGEMHIQNLREIGAVYKSKCSQSCGMCYFSIDSA